MKVLLKFPQEKDTNFLMKMKNDVVLQESLMCHPKKYTKHDINLWIKKYEHSDQRILFLIENEEKENIGYATIHNYLSINRTAYFAIAIFSKFQNKGYGSKALGELINFSTNKLGVRKLLLEVLLSNEKAIKLYSDFDFKKVGILVNHFYVRGKEADVLIMEKLLPFLNIGEEVK